MDFSEFDKHIKKTMSTERADVDINRLLTDLDLQKPNRRIIWIPLLLLGLSMVIGIGLFKLQKNPIQGQVSDLDPISATTSISNRSLNQAKQESSTNTEKITSTSIDLENQDLNLPAESIPNLNINTISRPTTNNEQTSYRINADSQAKLNRVVTTSSIKREKTIPATSSFIADNKITPTEDLVNAKAINQSLKSALPESGLTTTVTNASSLRTVRSMNILSSKLKPIENESIFKLKPQDCPSFREKQWSIAFVPEVSYDIQMKELSTSSPEFLDLVNERNNNESTLEGYGLGLSAMMYHKQGFYFKFGFNYSAFTERMDFSKTYTEMDTTQGIISITESQNGDTLTVIYGDIIINREITETTRAHYRFNMLDIPFSGGMSFDFGNIGLDAEAGVLFNIRTSTSGRVLNSDLNFVDLDNNPLFRKSLGIGYFGALYLRKNVTNRSSIIFGPKYRVRPRHYNTDQNPIQQKYSTLSFHLGYIYRL